MAKKNHTLGKVLALTTTAAAIGGACYIFRNEIKESSIYKKSAGKVSKLFEKISGKLCKEDEDDFFFDEDDDFYSDNIFSEDAKQGREYTSITINQKEEEDDYTEDEAVQSGQEQDTISSEVTNEPETPLSTVEADREDKAPATEDTSKEENAPSTVYSVKEKDIPTTADITNKDEADITKPEDMKEIFPEDTIPTITFGNNFSTPSSIPEPPTSTVKESASGHPEENVSAYENEGLSDVSEDPDVLEEQDKLDF